MGDNLLGEIREDVVAALRAERLKHVNVLGVGCCGVLKATACETAMELAVQVSSLLSKVPADGFANRSYVGSCAEVTRNRRLDKAEIDRLARDLDNERDWVTGG